jgi:hypothetical protein
MVLDFWRFKYQTILKNDVEDTLNQCNVKESKTFSRRIFFYRIVSNYFKEFTFFQIKVEDWAGIQGRSKVGKARGSILEIALENVRRVRW